MVIQSVCMQKLILTSSVSSVASDLPRHFGKNVSDIRVAFISTAAEVEEGDLWWLRQDRDALVDLGFKEVFDYTITGKSYEDLVQDLGTADVLFVSGGNSFYLLQEMRKSGFDRLMDELVTRGEKIYVGCSAGSVVVSSEIDIIRHLDDPGQAPELHITKGLGLVNFLILPHWGLEHFKEGYRKMMEYSYIEPQVPMILLTNAQYVLVEGDTFRIFQI